MSGLCKAYEVGRGLEEGADGWVKKIEHLVVVNPDGAVYETRREFSNSLNKTGTVWARVDIAPEAVEGYVSGFEFIGNYPAITV